eukprot:COSAG06_NODE_4143_length_4529_cov_7.605192_3_plen_139_part_00
MWWQRLPATELAQRRVEHSLASASEQFEFDEFEEGQKRATPADEDTNSTEIGAAKERSGSLAVALPEGYSPGNPPHRTRCASITISKQPPVPISTAIVCLASLFTVAPFAVPPLPIIEGLCPPAMFLVALPFTFIRPP